MVEKGRDINLKQVFFQLSDFSFFLPVTGQGKFNASTRLLYMFVYKAIKICWKIQITWEFLNWISTTSTQSQLFINSFWKHMVFHYSRQFFVDCTDNLYPVPGKSCHQIQPMGSAGSNSTSWSSSMLLNTRSKAPWSKMAHFRLSMSFKSSLVAASLACIIFNRARLNASDIEGEKNYACVIRNSMST